MRILYFSRAFTTHDRRFLSAIVDAGHEVGFLQLEDDGIRYDARALPKGVTSLAWAVSGRVDGPAAALARMPQLQKVLEDFRPDLVHAGPIQTCAFMAAVAGCHPLVAMSWGSDVLIDTDKDELSRWATEYTLKRANRVVCDCDAVRVRAKSIAGSCDDAFVQLPWGVDLDTLPLAPARAPAGRIEVLSVRSWDTIYGIDIVLNAFRIAHEKDPRLHLTLVGDGPLAATVERWIADSGLDRFIDRPGRIDQAALARQYRAADIYLTCALSDGTSVSLLEAMATGIVPVVTDAPGNREWVLPPQGGFLATSGDPNAFADALLRAASLSSQARADVIAHNRARVEERADWQKNVARLELAYRELAPTR